MPDACWQAGSLGAQLQAHSLQGQGPLTLQLPLSKRVPLEGAELTAYQEQKRKEEMGALQRAPPQASDSAMAEPLPTRCVQIAVQLHWSQHQSLMGFARKRPIYVSAFAWHLIANALRMIHSSEAHGLSGGLCITLLLGHPAEVLAPSLQVGACDTNPWSTLKCLVALCIQIVHKIVHTNTAENSR